MCCTCRVFGRKFLEAAGKIADGYPGIGAGYDSMVIDGLGLDAEAVRSYITNEKPSYTQFEAGSKTKKARSWTANLLTA